MVQPYLSKSIAVADNRGVFSATSFADTEWIQTNVSYNTHKDTFRGMHLQKSPHAQNKLVKVVNGSIIDVIIDLREDGHYMRMHTFHMEIGDELLVPKGFAHGFLTLEPHTVVQYLVDHPYTPEADVSINWKSFPKIAEMWDEMSVISDKDANAPNFEDVDL